MKEATGEVSMTVITLVAIGVIGAIIALFWPQIQTTTDEQYTASSSGRQYLRRIDASGRPRHGHAGDAS